MSAEVNHRHMAVIAGASAIASLIPVALRQLGTLSHLPDPPFSVFASDLITQSKAARPLGVPDSLLGIASYSASLALLLATPHLPWLKPLTRIKLWSDAVLAGVNSIRQVVLFRRICSWCLLTAAATGVMVATGRLYLR